MEKQQTAVDFYDQQLHILDLRLKSGSITIGEYFTLKSELFAQSKQMEKEQIIDAYDNGFDRCYTTRHRPYMVAEDYGKHYYESKYGKDEDTQI